jgi:hypothetical protein
MNNKKEEFAVKKTMVSKKKVAAATVMLAIVFGVGAYLFFSESARGFLRQGGAIAVESFGNIFSPSTSGSIVSEIDFSSPGMLSVVNERSNETSSVANNISAKKIRKAVANGTTTKNQNDGAANHANYAGVLAPRAVSSGSSFVAESSSTDISVPTMDAGGDTSSSSVASATADECSFPASVPANFSHRVILNEIAWMGSPTTTGEASAYAVSREWIELENIAGTEVSLDGWRIMDAAGKIKISFGFGDKLAPGMLYLLSRKGSSISGISADKAYTGVLSNDGDELVVLDASCGVSDFLDASPKWPGGSNTTKQTLERKTDLGWQTSATAGGTPRAENSVGVPTASATSSSTEKYAVNVAVAGNGGGSVTIKPNSTICKMACVNEYVKGTIVTLVATPGIGADFVGWSGGCSGASGCSFAVGGPVSVMAGFYLKIGSLPVAVNDFDVFSINNEISANVSSSLSDDVNATNTENESSTSTSSTPSIIVSTDTPSLAPSAPPAINHLVIAAVQIVGVAANDDFVKMYNPTPNAVDLSGFKLRKRSSTGTDSSLREFPKGSTIAPGGYFVWASSSNGFAQSIGADASSTGTLAANNSVALFDGSEVQIDAVAWGTGTNQYVEGAPYPDSPPASQVLERKFVTGAVIDTDNNAADFTL